MIELQPLWLTFKLAFFTTLILFVIAIPLANWLAHKKNIFKTIAGVIVSMPLVLPPSVIGFYMLVAFSPGNALVRCLKNGLMCVWFFHLKDC